MRNSTRREIVAMWLWGAEYARRGMGAIEFYAQLDNSRRHLVDDFLKELDNAPDAPARKKRKGRAKPRRRVDGDTA